MKPNKVKDVSAIFETYLSDEVKNNMNEKIYNTMYEDFPGKFYPVISILKYFLDKKDENEAVKALAKEVNDLYDLGKVWKGFLIRCYIMKHKETKEFSAGTYPLFYGSVNEKNEFLKTRKNLIFE